MEGRIVGRQIDEDKDDFDLLSLLESLKWGKTSKKAEKQK